MIIELPIHLVDAFGQRLNSDLVLDGGHVGDKWKLFDERIFAF